MRAAVFETDSFITGILASRFGVPTFWSYKVCYRILSGRQAAVSPGDVRRRSSESVLVCLHDRSWYGRWTNRRVGIAEETRERVGWTLLRSLRVKRACGFDVRWSVRLKRAIEKLKRDITLCFSGCQSWTLKHSHSTTTGYTPLTKSCNLRSVARNLDVSPPIPAHIEMP